MPLARLTFVGTGEAFDPDLPNTSLLYEGSARILLDCGYAVPHALWRMTSDPEALDAIYLTHGHADHCFGLPALVVWMRVAGRRRPLRLLGGPGASALVPRLLELGYPGTLTRPKGFPLIIEEVVPGQAYALEGLTLRTAPSAHSVPNHAVRIDDQHASVAYSGDGAPTAATTALFRGVGHLVHECVGPAPAVAGHACLEDVRRCAVEAAVTQVHLVHLSRQRANRARVQELLAAHHGVPRFDLPLPAVAIDVS